MKHKPYFLALLLVPFTIAMSFDEVYASDCTKNFGRNIKGAGFPNMASAASATIQADIKAGRKLEPVAAIKRLQKHLFHNPVVSNIPSTLGRCAPPDSYRQLNDEIKRVVNDDLIQHYQSKKRFLSNNNYNQPGLLYLLLLSNQTDQFLSIASTFLLSAKDNANNVADYFSDVSRLVQQRRAELADSQDYFRKYKQITILTDSEKQSFKLLTEIVPNKIDALRDQHIAYLLGKEQKSFSKGLKNLPPNSAMMAFNTDLTNSTDYLRQAINFARNSGYTRNNGNERQQSIRKRAENHGDKLMAENRPVFAVPFYEIAEAKSKLASAETRQKSMQQEMLEKTIKSSQHALENMQKKPEQSQAYKDEADKLADELGFDDF